MRSYRQALEDAIVSTISNIPAKGQGDAPVGWSRLSASQKVDVQRIVDSINKLNDLLLSIDSPPKSDIKDESTKS